MGSGVSVSLCSVVGGCQALWAHSSVCGAAAGGGSWLVGCCWGILGKSTGFTFLRQGKRMEVNRQALCCFVTPARAVGTSLSLAKLSQRMWEAFSAGLVPAPCYLKP